MNEVRNSLCPYITIELFCQGYFILMKTTNKGCANKASLLLNRDIKGNETDLTALTFDVSQWTDIEIAVINKAVTIKINDKVVYSTHFTTDTKYLTGLGYISNGLVEVDGVELGSLEGKVMYKNNFEASER